MRHEYIDDSVLEMLREMQVGTQTNLFKEIIEVYLKTAPIELRKIKDSLPLRDYSTICHAAHTLRSSSGNVGAILMLRAATAIEESLYNCVEEGGAPPPLEVVEQMVSDLMQYYVKTSELLAAEIQLH